MNNPNIYGDYWDKEELIPERAFEENEEGLNPGFEGGSGDRASSRGIELIDRDSSYSGEQVGIAGVDGKRAVFGKIISDFKLGPMTSGARCFNGHMIDEIRRFIG